MLLPGYVPATCHKNNIDTAVLHTGLATTVVGVGTLGVSCRQGRAWYRERDGRRGL